MKELYLIRHGKTYGNTLGRYIGTTDEPLCEEGREALQAIFEAGLYPMPDVLYGSPLKRCRETGAILFPGKEVLADLKGKAVHRAALVVHGGTIMSILAAYAAEKEEFYHWQIKNGEGFRMLVNETEKGGVFLDEISHLCLDSGLCAGSDLR